MPKLDVRGHDGKPVELIVGAWYVGVNWLDSIEGTGPSGPIAEYVGDGEFYEEGCDEPARMQEYEYIQFSHTPSRWAEEAA